MPIHNDKIIAPHSANQMFDLVMDIANYPKFLPWCKSASIHERGEGYVIADLTIGYKMMTSTYRSKVKTAANRIEIEYLEGPFKKLQNHWQFTPLNDNTCEVDFFIDFEFKSSLFQHMIEALFSEAVGVMIKAFEGRARAVYLTPQ